jgi:biopolymer transport protein ExbD
MRRATVRTLISVLSVLASLTATVGASAQAPAARPAAFVLSVDREGALFATVEGAPSRLDESAVRERAAAALREDIGATFTVEADAAAPRQSVIQAAQLLQQAGVTKIGFRTRPDRP